MAWKYIIFLNLLIVSVNSTSKNTPEVYENVKEEETASSENIRVVRHPKFRQLHEPPNFDFKAVTQQDPQRIRYAQQQKIDSYVRAYQQEQSTKVPVKQRKVERNPTIDKTTYDTRPKSENRQPSQKQINFNRFPSTVITDQHSKKVDPVQLHKVPHIDNSREESINGQKKSVAPQEKASLKSKLGYQVSETFSDQETEPSSNHESTVYFGQEQIVKTVQDYPIPLSPNYLAKPTYMLANPQMKNLILDPKLLTEGIDYKLPANHQLSYAGFEPASKTDLEALSSLLGKSPNIQLQGLNDILNNQYTYAATAASIPIPDTQQVIIQEAVEPKQFVPAVEAQPLVAVQPIIAQQPIVAAVHHQPIVSAVQHLPIQSIKDHTPIKEDVFDIAKPQVKPETSTISPVNIKSHTNVNRAINPAKKSKGIYDDHDNLQYAAQYAFGYKIRDFHSGNNFGHEEVREGNVAKGHYHVLLPDGRLQNVDYWADPSGYHATVTYSNVAHH